MCAFPKKVHPRLRQPLDQYECVTTETRPLDRLGQLGEFEQERHSGSEQDSNTDSHRVAHPVHACRASSRLRQPLNQNSCAGHAHRQGQHTDENGVHHHVLPALLETAPEEGACHGFVTVCEEGILIDGVGALASSSALWPAQPAVQECS